MGWYHLAKTIFLKKYPKMLDLLLVAVKPEYQNKGVNALLFSDLIPVYQQLGFEYAESNRAGAERQGASAVGVLQDGTA